MKKRFGFIFLSLALMLSLTTPAFAEGSDFVINDGVLTRYNGSGGNVVIPNSVTEIGERAFSGRSDLVSVIIPGSVTSIGKDSFSSCYNLKSVKISNGVKYIGENAFAHCQSLDMIAIPSSVISVDRCAFWRCSSLSNLDLADGITEIGSQAFDQCGLTNITIPATVTSIDAWAFARNTTLKEIQVASGNPAYADLNGVLFNKDLTELIQYPIGRADVAYSIPKGTTLVNWNAFEGCSSLTSVVIPNSVLTIWMEAFANCANLTDVVIPSSVNELGGGVFANCPHLTTISVAKDNPVYVSIDGVVYSRDETQLVQYPIGKKATTYHVRNGVTQILYSAFDGCCNLNNIYLPDGLKEIGFYTFRGCTGLTDISIPDGVSYLGSEAFKGCTSLTTIRLPTTMDSKSHFGSSLFSGCTSLIAVSIPNGVTQISGGMFMDCENLSKVVIPEGVISFNTLAFVGCNSLTEITIPASVQGISLPDATELIYGTSGSYAEGYAKRTGRLFLGTFSDVPNDAYYSIPVAWAVQQNITVGTSASRFSPNATCTNGQILTFLWRAIGKPESNIQNPFSNIDPNGYYYKAALWAYEFGLVTGSTFDADIPCTRAMTVTYLWKLCGAPDTVLGVAPFSDVPVDADYAVAVDWAVKLKITSGTSATTFSPNATCTRGQIVTFLHRACTNAT